MAVNYKIDFEKEERRIDARFPLIHCDFERLGVITIKSANQPLHLTMEIQKDFAKLPAIVILWLRTLE